MQTSNTSALMLHTALLLTAAILTLLKHVSTLEKHTSTSSKDANCPIKADTCVCEDLLGGGHNIYCPNRQDYSVVIHYETPYTVFLVCNPHNREVSRRGGTQYSTDVIFQLRNLTVGRVEWLQLKGCPMPTNSISMFMESM